MALHDLATNTPILGFPGTLGQLTTMAGAGIDNVLTALNLQTTGTVAERRQRLRVHIGFQDESA